MTNKAFEIQGTTLRIGGVDLQAGTTGVVIPGVTQATSYKVDEVEDRADQTDSFATIPTVIDAAHFNNLAGNYTSYSNFEAATYTVKELDDDGFIDGIDVELGGNYDDVGKNWASGSMFYAVTEDPINNFNPADWNTIPFSPKFRAGEVENIGGGGASLTVSDGNSNTFENINTILVGGAQLTSVSEGVVGITITSSSSTPGQVGYFAELKNTADGNRADGEAVAVDSDGNSYVSYSYYDNNASKMVGGIIKFNSTGEKQWSVNVQSSNSNADYSKITSLEHTLIGGNPILIAIGYYYDNNVSRDVGFMYYVDPANGAVITGFNTEVTGTYGIQLNDAVFGLDSTDNPFAVMVGNSYNEMLQKTFTPLAGSTVDKVYVTWAEFNASGLTAGDQLIYTVGGYAGIYVNMAYANASLDGIGYGISVGVSATEAGAYVITRVNGYSGVINDWTVPVTLTVLGSNLGGVDGVNDLTFDFNRDTFYNTNDITQAVSNIQGTPITDVYCQGWNGRDWSADIGTTLTFDYQLNDQAYIARLGSTDTWSKNLGASNYDKISSVVVDVDGNIYAVGTYSDNIRSGLVFKYNQAGTLQWSVYIDPANRLGMDVLSVDLLSDGNLITVGDNGIVTKINSSTGAIIWQVQNINRPSWDSDFKGTATPDGDYIITNYEDNNYTLYVVRLSGVDGSEVWAKQISRAITGSNGEIYPQNDFRAQYIDCNDTQVTIGATTYLYVNGNSTYAGLVITLPIDGVGADGAHGEYTVTDATLEWEVEATTSVEANIAEVAVTANAGPSDPTGSASDITVTKINIGGTVSLGDITFEGIQIKGSTTVNANGSIELVPNHNLKGAGQYLNIYPTNQFDYPHIHIAAGSGGDLFVGDDSTYVSVGNDGVIKINNGGGQWQFGTDGLTTLPGAIVKSTIAKNGSGDPAYPTAIDLTKSINKLSGNASSTYTLADGVEGQIIYLVPQAMAMPDILIIVANANDGTVTGQNWQLIFPATGMSSIITLIFVDNAWKQSGGEWLV